tara:strand:+ start:177 stop:473 length:297 start_codon:yes stop_codon:yes gene_type:complete
MIKFFVMITAISSYSNMPLRFNLKNRRYHAACVEDFECELPFRCCKGVFFNYCCSYGGHGARIPKPHLPNITFPPIRIPVPYPVPEPIPIPVPIPVNP